MKTALGLLLFAVLTINAAAQARYLPVSLWPPETLRLPLTEPPPIAPPLLPASFSSAATTAFGAPDESDGRPVGETKDFSRPVPTVGHASLGGEENNKAYAKSRLKAFGFATLYSLQFELGPLSEASLGNAGPGPYSPHPTSYQDLVLTPLVGAVWIVGEDALDRYLIRRIEKLTGNRVVIGLARSFLNPSRAMANALRLEGPWHRDTR